MDRWVEIRTEKVVYFTKYARFVAERELGKAENDKMNKKLQKRTKLKDSWYTMRWWSWIRQTNLSFFREKLHSTKAIYVISTSNNASLVDVAWQSISGSTFEYWNRLSDDQSRSPSFADNVWHYFILYVDWEATSLHCQCYVKNLYFMFDFLSKRKLISPQQLPTFSILLSEVQIYEPFI